ncbi:MAG TPA: restriction endonuclease subunit S [Syntrophorhabdus aromaticivorans]|nr:restriction endonuclease subunit S [Syntrophorhabdus aromaticivorans]
MISGLKPYPVMKDSGVPWLGEVPEHWEVLPLARLLRERKERNNPVQTNNILSLSLAKGVTLYADKKPGGNKAKEDLSAYMLAYPGDIVVNSMNVVVGSVGLSSYFGAVSPVYYMLRPWSSSDLVEYFDAIFHNVTFQRSLFGLGNGILYIESKSSGKLNTIRLRIPMSKLKRVLLPYPSPKEQSAIVRFLDHADRKIRRYIRAKQKLIKLLEEQKQAIIHRAVTRGIDANVRLSSIPGFLFDKLPSHWPILRAKLLFRQVEPIIPDNAEIITCFRDGRVTLRRNRRTTGFTNAIKELGYQGIKPGQLVLHSMDAFAGAIGVSDSTGKCSPEYVICEPAVAGVLPHYYAHLLRSLALRGLFVVMCAAVRERAPRVRFTHFGTFSLPKPL